MTQERFRTFSTNIALIVKSVQKIKNNAMRSFGLRGTHVMCLFYLQTSWDGLTAAELSKLCKLDKAAISRTVSELESLGYVSTQAKEMLKKYRAKIELTEAGFALAGKIDAIIADSVEQAGAGLSDAERAVFYQSLEKITENLQQMAKS